jgi:hypothetical protein
MYKLKSLAISIILVMSVSLTGPSFDVSARPLSATSPTLGAAASYSVLAGSIVTNTGATTMPGDLGVSPSIGVPPHVTGFPPGSVGPPGSIHDADGNAAAAQAQDTAAFTFLNGQGCDMGMNFGAGLVDLVGKNLVAGVYCADAFTLTGVLTLSGSGVWIFRSASTLITSTGEVAPSVVGGDPCNVWWTQVSSATLGTGTSFIGNILSSTSNSLQTGASLNGRVFAQTGEVSLDTNTITGGACLTTVPSPQGKGEEGKGGGGQKKKAVVGLPNTGGAPIRNEDFPWSLAIVGGLGALALVVGVPAYRRRHLPKQ